MYVKMLYNNVQLKSLMMIVIIVTMKTYYVKPNHGKKPGLIYMLLWSALDTDPFIFWSEKTKSFHIFNCKYQNCYVVKDREYFEDLTDYDAILFTVKGIVSKDLPLARSDNQLYVFVSVESPTYFPFNDDWNWFFNYTWTYKLDSDIPNPYFIVRNRRGEIVGPKINARWRNVTTMRPITDIVKEKLNNKTIAAAWFITNCHGTSKRLAYGHGLNRALGKYNLNVDIYGLCGNKYCSKGTFADCLKHVETNYYFYLAFENSNHEDYVTEKLITALGHYTVPVVIGGADYSRFMPKGIYLNGNTLSEEEVAERINEAIQDKQKYYDYFRWHRYYKYNQSEGTDADPLCTFCAMLNDDSIRNHRRVYARFNKWWNEYRSQDDDKDIIVNYDDSGSYIKSVLTYREPKIEVKTDNPSSALDHVNSFIGDIINYYFP